MTKALKIISDFYEAISIPSKAVMGLVTMSLLVFCYVAVFFDKKIPTEVMTFYGMVLGAYAVSKTITGVQEIKAASPTDTTSIKT